MVEQQGVMNIRHPTVFVVDDDAMIRQALVALLESEGLHVQAFRRAKDFLDAYLPDSSGCLLLDIDLPDIDGLKLQELLAEMQLHIPIIFLTGQATVPKTIQALKTGAFDFLDKPASAVMLLERINQALAKDARERAEALRRSSVQERFERLTRREREVMTLLVTGYTNKQMAQRLNISIRTIEGHRRRVYEKMGSVSFTNLIEMARLTGLLRQKD